VASFNLEVDRGVLAVQVESSKPAAAAGLSFGDVITAIDNVPLYNISDFWHVYLRQGEGAPAQVTVFGKNGQVTLTLPRASVPAQVR
jgi:S1-C subfamily serine protease